MNQAATTLDRTSPGYPEGLKDANLPDRQGNGHASPRALLVLGLIMALAMSGLLGGVPKPTVVAETPSVRLEVDAPQVLRNGEFFETQITVVPRRGFDELSVGVTPSWWRDITINTFIPAPAEESYQGGAFRFSFGPAEAGEPLVVKIDGQINPSLLRGTRGRVIVYDGETPVASLPVELRVLP